MERRRFHIPKNVLKLKQKRCKRRREYRAYMRSRVSELRRKEEAKWLRKHPTSVKKPMHRAKKWNKKAQIKVMRTYKANKRQWRLDWRTKRREEQAYKEKPWEKEGHNNKNTRWKQNTEKKRTH